MLAVNLLLTMSTVRHFSHIPSFLFSFAFALWVLAHLSGVRVNLPLLWGAYWIMWLTFLVEIRYFQLKSRKNRIRAYVILLVANSFVATWQIAGMLGSPPDLLILRVLVLLWLLTSWISFIAVFFLTTRSDTDLPIDVRLTPFAFSLVGALTSWLWTLSI